jgi:hypothetical protein
MLNYRNCQVKRYRDVKNSSQWILGPWMLKSKIKTMLTCFFDIRGFIHFESVPERATVNQTFYMVVSKMLIAAVRRKQGELWRHCSLILHPDMHRHILHSECHSLYKENTFLPWIISHTLLTWLQLTSGSFQNSKSVLFWTMAKELEWGHFEKF